MAYGEVAGARDPIHIDPEYARHTRFGRNIAQGLLILTLLSRLMTRAFEEAWLNGGSLEVRFTHPVCIGDRIIARGIHREDAPGHCMVWVENQHGRRVIDGKAAVLI
jgi:3-hydroxybutyryl-CoA dehydratase